MSCKKMGLINLILITKARSKDRISEIQKTGLAFEVPLSLVLAKGTLLVQELLTATVFTTSKSLLLEMPSKSFNIKRITGKRRSQVIGRPK